MFLLIINGVNRKIGEILCYLIWFLVIIIVLEVLLRYFFNKPTDWVHETASYVFGGYAVILGGSVLLQKGHIRVDILWEKLSKSTQLILDMITSGIFFLFVLALLWYGWEMALESLQIFEHSTSPWGPPLYPFKLTIPLGALLLLFQGISKFVSDLVLLITGKELP